MAQDASILPQCVQSAAIQGMAMVGCPQSLDCACHSLKFLNLLQVSILTSCDSEDQALALSTARQYCAKANPDLLSSRTTVIYTTIIVFATLAIASVILRFWARRAATTQLGWDDWFVAAGLVFGLASDALVLVGLSFGGARHSFMVNPTAITLKTNLATDWVFTASNVLVRLSILALYMRIFSTMHTFRSVLHVSGWIVVILQTALVLLYTFSCQPVSYFWNKEIQGGHCLDQARILAGSGGVDTATGIWVLILPLPVIRRLHTGLKRKLALVGLFSIGAFVCVTAILRVPFILKIDPNDPDWSIVPFSVWTAIEVNLSVVSVCLPTMAPLFRGWLPNLISTIRSRSSQKRHSKILPEDEAYIYTGGDGKETNRTETKITTSRPGEGAKRNE